MNPSPLLELRGVTKRYGTHRVLGGIDLSLSPGEFVAIVGYSGAGKTTLLSLVAGLLRPDAGSILFDGRPVEGPGPERAVIFQNYSLLPWMTAFENVALAVDQVFPDRPAAERHARVEKYLDMVKLSAARDKKPHELSGGMRQRVAVARALAMDPAVLLMDEPLGALDALTRATLQDEIERIWREDRKTALLITNDVDEGILLADRIIPLSMGPGAVLGPAVAIDLPRPRDRKAINHDPGFQKARNAVLQYLLGPGKQPQAAAPAPQEALA
jgi:nitrate/nitrite transport system ATP-binding protein